MQQDHRGLFAALIGTGRPLITFCGICLGLSGLFAIFQSLTGHFLPHDIAYLRMRPDELCGINECRIVHFMIHDRISFGGALVAIAVLHLWLAEFPLRHGETWAWWTLVISGVSGFGSFLSYLGYGYLDTWHGAATLGLLPCFIRRPLDVASEIVKSSTSSVVFRVQASGQSELENIRRSWPHLPVGIDLRHERGWSHHSSYRHERRLRAVRSGLHGN